MSGIKGKYRYVLFMPSFYALVTFPIFHILYLLNVFPYEEKNIEAQIICFTATIFFLSSFLWNYSNYKKMVHQTETQRQQIFSNISYIIKFLLIVFLLIGILGCIKYIIDFSTYFGGYWIFFLLLVEDSAQIRIAQQFATSIGFQVTYFSWIAGSILFAEAALKNISRWYILIFILVLLLNILFIDRTRPITLIFTTLLFLFFIIQSKLSSKILQKAFVITLVSLFAVYIALGEWIGKVSREDQYGKTIVPPMFQTAFLYGTSSFGYFNRIVNNNESGNYIPERSLYPFFKISSAFKLTSEPPEQINEFYYIPQDVNIGTFLEPLYRDGGWVFCLLGIILHSFLFDLLGLYFIKNSNRFALYALTILCFCNFFAFFSPKFNNIPIWLFISIGFLEMLYIKVSPPLVKELK